MNTNQLQPLGVFAAVGFSTNAELTTPVLKKLEGAIQPADRAAIASYLRSGTCIDAWMEATSDLLGDRFVVPGGSAIETDGTYFWRADTADYVEHYGVALPGAFLEHVRRSGPAAKAIETDDQQQIFDYFREFYRNNSTVDIVERAAAQL